MTNQETIQDQASSEQVAGTPAPQTETMRPQHVTEQEYADPQEPAPEVAGLTLVLIIGSIFLTMIVVMVIAFMYFNSNEGATSLVLPLFG